MSEQAATPEAATTSRLVVRSVLRTDVGRVRSENQDFGTFTTPDEEGGGPGGRLLIVADGMGGHRGGATASRLSAETVKAQYLGSEAGDIPTVLREALTRANARIFSEAQANPDLRGMGTTTSALAVLGDSAWFAHVGDSRIYMIRGDEIKQLTDDHSLVATMVREGLLTAQEAETHPRRNVLQRSMGVAEEVDVDVRGPIALQPNDTFILCSDGLHGVVKEDEMREVARLPIEQAADEFVRRALERGAPDNVTVIVARVESLAESPASFDDTQPDVPEDLLFDQTVREAPTDPAIPIVVPVATPEAPPPPPPATPPAPATPAVATTPPAATPSESAAPAVKPAKSVAFPAAEPAAAAITATGGPTVGSLLKWMLIAILALGAAGVLFFRFQNPATSPSSTRPRPTVTP